MANQSKDFRENPQRAVFICGEIDELLVHRLMPEIVRLRGQRGDPITAYIDSRGGLTVSAEHLRALFKTPDADGVVCRLITVATTHAASAAADLLALGDYAIAYPHAVVHCHGTRLSADEITKETAEDIAASLHAANEDFALRLAKRVFGRMAFHYTVLQPDFANLRQRAHEEKFERRMDSDLECFAFALFSKLSLSLKNLPQDVFFLYETLVKMRDYVLERSGQVHEGQSRAEIESNILKHLIDFELTQKETPDWLLSRGGFEALALDFRRLADFLFGMHHNALDEHIQSFGVLFLDPEQLLHFENLRATDPEDASKWMKTTVQTAIEPLWYFVVALCRRLQQGENRLSALDAYWLGLVDEVIGLRIPSLRLIAENPDV